MKDYFILTFSENCDAKTASDAVKMLSKNFPEKNIIALPEVINLKQYSKEELINLLNFYIDYMKGLIND